MELFFSFPIIFLTIATGAFAAPGNGSRVYGGYKLSITDAPWMAHIKYYYTDETGTNWVSGCGGTIFNEMFILTAAHCATEEVSGGRLKTKIASQYRIRIGSSNKDKGGYLYGVARVFPHPNYEPDVKPNDVALLKLTKKITYKERTVQKVNLDTREYGAGQKVSSMGWGDNPKNPGTPLLFIVDLNIVDITKCARQQRGASVAEYKQHKICAIGPNKADVCKGDSGGPLMVGHNNQQIGIVSYGANCPQPGQTAPSAGVYTKIGDNMAWINSVVSGSKDQPAVDEEHCNHEPQTIHKPSIEKVKPSIEEVGTSSEEVD